MIMSRGEGWYSPKIPIRVCAAQQGRDFGTPDLEQGIHIRDFLNFSNLDSLSFTVADPDLFIRWEPENFSNTSGLKLIRWEPESVGPSPRSATALHH